MQNKMTHLRNHLFETLEMLKDQDNPMDLDRAKVISEVAQTLINSAKVEVDFIKATEQTEVGSEFFEVDPVQVEFQPKRIRGL